MICLDTNAVIAAITGRSPRVRSQLIATLAAGTGVAIPVIVLYELRYGIKKSEQVRMNASVLAALLTLDLRVWAFDADDAEEAGDIRVTLERLGTPIGPYDILIAAQARRRDATLVTANDREFGRVAGLRTVNWARG
jgi:tRNA(fMet)-specific endonuclease VapC